MHTWIILAQDEEAIHCYRFTAPTTSIEQVRTQFKHIAISEGWEPFREITVLLVPNEPQQERFSKVGTFLTK